MTAVTPPHTVRLGVVMDPIGSIAVAKDTTFALLLAAQARSWEVYYLEPDDLSLRDGVACGRRRRVIVDDDPADWYRLGEPEHAPLSALDLILMRQDPPVDTGYLHTTRILSHAEAAGVRVANRPATLRDVNEKLYAQQFPELCAPTLVSSRSAELVAFVEDQSEAILKPLDGMGGRGVFRTGATDPNRRVIAELLTRGGRDLAMAQRYLPAIAEGDKRILIIGGEPYPYCLARLPAAGEHRGNLAAGGRGEGRALTEQDRRIALAVAPDLTARGVSFAGLDVIGEQLTEINITSPTCVRELERLYQDDIAGRILDAACADRAPGSHARREVPP